MFKPPAMASTGLIGDEQVPNEQTRLERAFVAFNQFAEQLSAAYRDLEARATVLASELAHSRREQAQLAERLSALLDSLPGGVLVVDAAGRIRQSNATVRQWLQQNPDEQLWAECLEAVAVGQSAAAGEISLPGPVQVTVSRSAVTDRGETILLLTDVTEQRRLARELDHNRRLAAMGEMAAHLAHQVRTPLSAALLYADHLTTRALESDCRALFGERLLNALRDLERLTRDMLGFVRGGCGQSMRIDLQDLLTDLDEAVAGTRPARARLVLDAAGVGGAVQGDRQVLLGAICNLLENAWLSTDAPIEVTVQLRMAGAAAVEIWIIDNGSGVPPELLDRLFEPFVSGRSGGTGLGLAVAAAAAEAHGGSLRLAHSSASGSRFVMRLPLVQHGRQVHGAEAAA